MNVSKLCQRNVITVRPTDELTSASKLMREHHIGYLIVVEPDLADDGFRPIGVLTDRDIVVSVLARDAPPRMLTVGDVMTRGPVVVGENEQLDTALQSMRRIGVRRVPVVGNRGQLVGVLSLDDVLDSLAEQLQNLAGSVRNEQRIEGALRP